MTNVTNIADVKDAMETLLLGYPDLDGVRVQVDEPIPVATDQHPWVGIFSFGQDLITRLVGAGMGNRRQNCDWALFLAASDAASGRDCGRSLDQLMQRTLAALLSDPSIGGTTLGIGETMTTAYLDRKFQNSNFTQIGRIQFTTLGNTY